MRCRSGHDLRSFYCPDQRACIDLVKGDALSLKALPDLCGLLPPCVVERDVAASLQDFSFILFGLPVADDVDHKCGSFCVLIAQLLSQRGLPTLK